MVEKSPIKFVMMKQKTLIIIPGWGGSHETWAKFMDLARPHFKDVVCIDLPCFGGNACPKTVWGVEQYSEYVKRKLEKMPEEGRVIVGHSFGGQVSAHLVANNPGICEKYVLYAGAVFRPKRPIRRAFFWVIAKTGKILFRLHVIENIGVWAKKVLYKTAGSPDYSKTSGIQQEIFKKIIRQDLSLELPKIKVPTLIVWGTLDRYVPLKDGKRARQLIAESRLEVVAGAGHGIHLSHGEKLLQIIESFVQ